MDLARYILDGHTPVHVTDTLEWGHWLETHRAECQVGHDLIGPYRVSTIFLGLDHNRARLFHPDNPHAGPPLLFESMVFVCVGYEDRLTIQERCSTWEEAEAQHARLAGEIRKAVNG